MTLSEVYFYMLIIIFLIFSFLIVFFSEDLKSRKYFLLFLKITFLIGWIGIVIQILGWNFLCKYELIVITFFPFITLLMTKVIMLFYEKMFKKEPFHLHRKDVLDGIWVKNKWDSKNLYYHTFYSISIFLVPMTSFVFLLKEIKRSFC